MRTMLSLPMAFTTAGSGISRGGGRFGKAKKITPDYTVAGTFWLGPRLRKSQKFVNQTIGERVTKVLLHNSGKGPSRPDS